MQLIPRKFKRVFTATFTAAFLALPVYTVNNAVLDPATAEADVRPSAHLARREMKKDRNYQPGSLYSRAHEMIYGKGGAVAESARPRIAVLINGDEDLMVEDKVKNEIYRQLRQKFPREYFALIKGTDMNTRLLQYAEEMYYDKRENSTVSNNSNRIESTGSNIAAILGLGVTRRRSEKDLPAKSAPVDTDGMPVGIRPRGLSDMRREDYVRVAKELGYDYAFVMTLNNGQGTSDLHHWLLFNTKTDKHNVWLRMRFIDVRKGNYMYRNDIPAQGKSHNRFISGKAFERSVGKAMQEALDDIEVDTGVGLR